MPEFTKAFREFTRALRLGAPKAVLSRRYDALKAAWAREAPSSKVSDEAFEEAGEALRWAYLTTCGA